MALSPGARLGGFEILALLGAGGMGEVYRARDPRLGRDVALKVLPDTFASDPERLARFGREARTLAALNHPHIAQIHGLEESSGVSALVMELVEGEDLAQRLARGAIPLDEALPVALQIADALEAAHEAGIIHRDLKPSNIKVRPDGTVKVLDFGLAKALDPSPAALGAGDPANSPTITSPAMTMRGVILGTAAYMAPEQARGKAVDRRADIWAFGCVLYEMLAGRRPFEGNTISEVIAKVLEREPDWTRLPGSLPGGLVRLMRRCLEKDPRRRIRDIGDVRLELEDAQSVRPGSETTTPRAGAVRRVMSWSIPILLSLGAVAAVMWQTRGRAPSVQQPAHLQIELPAGVHLAVDTDHPVLALSPDGAMLVFVGDEHGTRRLYLRRLADRDSRPIPGTEGAASPFFSPDGAWVAYYTGWGLAKVGVRAGVPLPALVTSSFTVSQGAVWVTADSVVAAVSVNSGLTLAPISGDMRHPVTAHKQITPSNLHYAWPAALPDGRHVLFTDNTGARPRVATIDTADGRVTPLVNGATNARYSAEGYLVFGRDGALYAVPFDTARLATAGEQRKILDGVLTQSNGVAQFAVAANGVLAYVAGTHTTRQQELVWVDRHGKPEVLPAGRDRFLGPRFSPDGRQLAVASFEGANLDIWRLDTVRGTLTRVTTHPGEDLSPVWSPDGKRMALATEIGEDTGGEQGPALGRIGDDGRLEQLLRSPAFGDWEFPTSWSPDGSWIAYMRTRGGVSRDIMLFPTGGGDPVAFLDSPANEYAATFSPDGKWVAFVSDQSDRLEVYVAPFPGPGERIQISTGGGVEPVWARNGRELFYREGNKLMAVAFPGGSIAAASVPRAMFEWRFESTDGMGAETANYDVSPDGRRFVMVRRKNLVTPKVIHIVLNWPEALAVHAAGAVR